MLNRTLLVIFVCSIALAHAARRRRDRPDRDSLPDRVDPVQARTATATTLACPVGYCLIGSDCLKATLVDPLYRCPAGHEEINGECVWYMPMSEMDCSRGNQDEICTQLGPECVCRVRETKIAACPDGTEFDSEKCGMMVDAPINCPEGSALMDGKCAEFVPMDMGCPIGSLLARGVQLCESVDEVPAIESCPEGTRKFGSLCETEFPVAPVCGPGETDTGDQCVLFHEKVQDCPDGMKLEKNRCVDVIVEDRRSLCPNGGNPTKDCELKVSGPMIASCTEGNLVNGQCVKEEESRAFAQCPKDYDFEGERCVKRINYECGETEWSVECEDPPVCDEFITSSCIPMCNRPTESSCLKQCEQASVNESCIEEAGSQGRNLRDSPPRARRALRVRHPPPEVQSTGNLPICHRVPVINSKTCVQEVVAEATPFCREGQYKGRGMCARRVQRQPEMTCKGTLNADGSCTMKERVPVVFGCRPGFTSISGRCEATVTATPRISCAGGRESNGDCVTIREKKCSTPDCRVTATSDPVATCPDGYVKERSSDSRIKSRNGWVCQNKVFSEPEPQCPPNTFQNTDLSCIRFLEEAFTQTITSVSAQLVCPIGTQTIGGECIREERFRVGQQCANGDTSSSCAVKVPKVRMCPSGSRDQFGHCFVIGSTDSYGVETIVMP